MNYILQYNEALRRGEIPACKRIKAVYSRLAGEIEAPGRYIFDEAKANRPIAFIERFCRHSKGEWAGQPVRLELFLMRKAIVNDVCLKHSDYFIMQNITDAYAISDYYQSYIRNGGNPEFLYIPQLDEVNDELNRGMLYLGILDEKQQIVAMQEFFQLAILKSGERKRPVFPDRFASFAFHPPMWDYDPHADYYAVSGIYVDPNYRRMGLATRLLDASIAIAERFGARGIYGDPNYLNLGSQWVISQKFDLIGCTDGVTAGPENEKSIYLTYYHSFFSEPPHAQYQGNVPSNMNLLEVKDTLLNILSLNKPMSKYDFPYGDGRNHVYVFNEVAYPKFVLTSAKMEALYQN